MTAGMQRCGISCAHHESPRIWAAEYFVVLWTADWLELVADRDAGTLCSSNSEASATFAISSSASKAAIDLRML